MPPAWHREYWHTLLSFRHPSKGQVVKGKLQHTTTRITHVSYLFERGFLAKRQQLKVYTALWGLNILELFELDMS